MRIKSFVNILLIVFFILLLSPFIFTGDDVDHNEYYPASEANGGWRKNDSEKFIRSLGLIPKKLEEFGQYNLSLPNDILFPYTDYKGTIVIKDGWIVGEWYSNEQASQFKNYLSSNGKAFAMICFGIMADDSRNGSIPFNINIDSYLYDKKWLSQGFPLSDPRKSKITFEQIFQHTSGLCPERNAEGEEIEKGRNRWGNHIEWLVGHDERWPQTQPLYYSPGHAEEYSEKTFNGTQAIAYSSVGMGHLGIVYQNVYSKPAHEFLWERLLQPIGFSGIDFHDPPSEVIKWFSAGGLRMTPRDYARFAYLLFKDGKWGNQQIVSSEWIKKFRCSSLYPNIRSNIDGKFGQKYPRDMFRVSGSGINMVFIIPSMNIIALRTGRVNNVFWDEVEKTFLEKLFAAIEK